MEKETFLQLSKKNWKKGGGLAVSSRGGSGGIGALWDDQKFELIESKHHIHWILTKLMHKETNVQLSLFNIYVPIIFAEKKYCWNCLREVRSNTTLEYIILAGDLNIILNQAEKIRGSKVRDPIRELVDDLILEWELSNVIPFKVKFTWTNKRLGP